MDLVEVLSTEPDRSRKRAPATLVVFRALRLNEAVALPNDGAIERERQGCIEMPPCLRIALPGTAPVGRIQHRDAIHETYMGAQLHAEERIRARIDVEDHRLRIAVHLPKLSECHDQTIYLRPGAPAAGAATPPGAAPPGAKAAVPPSAYMLAKLSSLK